MPTMPPAPSPTAASAQLPAHAVMLNCLLLGLLLLPVAAPPGQARGMPVARDVRR